MQAPQAEAVAPAVQAPLSDKVLGAAASGRTAYVGLTLRLLGSLMLPLVALGLSWALLRLAGRPMDLDPLGDALLLMPLLLGQVAAAWHWFVRGAVFARGVRLFTLLAGLALGVWLLLILEPLQRHTLQAALALLRGSAWEGLAGTLSWAVLACAVPLLGVACLLLWRRLAQAVLDAQLAVSAAHDLIWVLAVTAGCVVLWALWAPFGLPGASALALGDKPWATAAQRLSLFVDGPALLLLTFSVMYALLRLGLGWLQSDRQRAMPSARKPLPPLVLLDLRRPQDCTARDSRDLHALACTWGQERGPVLLLRVAAQVLSGAGQHVRWAQAARRLPELFVSGADAARRWCATWLAPGGGPSGPFVRECLLGPGGDMRHLVLALRVAAPDALFLVLPGAALADEDSERLRLALPKARCLALAVGGLRVERDLGRDLGHTAMARLLGIEARISQPWQRQALAQTLTQRLQAPPQQARLAVIGRPRSDRLADAVVAAVDQRVLPGTDTPVDAQRPARDTQGGFARLLLLLDAAWLADEAEAVVEAAALQPLVRSVLAAGGAGSVVLMSAGPLAAAPTQQAAAQAWARCGGVGAARYLGHLPEDPGTWAEQGVLNPLMQGGEVTLAAAAQAEPTPARPALAATQAQRPLSDFSYCAYLSYAYGDDQAWSGWVGSFGRELEIGLQAQLRGIKLPPLYRAVEDGPEAVDMKGALSERLAAAFALIIVVHEHYVQSQWSLKKLELFAAQRAGTAWQQQVYVVALSQPAMHRVMSSAGWKRVFEGHEMVWLPFFDPQAPDKPLPVYLDSGVVSPKFREPFTRLRLDFAERLRQAAVLPPSPPVAGRALRIYIESSREQPRLWEDLGEQMRRLWDELLTSWDTATQPALRLRGLPLDVERELLPTLGDADGVVLLAGTKPLELLLQQIESVESRLSSGRLPGLLVAEALALPARASSPLPWPTLAWGQPVGPGPLLDPEQQATLTQFLRQVWERQRPRAEA